MGNDSDRKVVLVTGIGGNVAQGILRNIRAFDPTIWLVGTDITDATAGHYFCDRAYCVPLARDRTFLKRVAGICSKESVQLVIPGTDDESYVLSAGSEVLPKILCSPASTAKVFLDKYLTYEKFLQAGISFAETTLCSSYSGTWQKNVLKPREGRGSRGVVFDIVSAVDYDDSNIVQERVEGEELTSAFYVSQQNLVIGQITFSRQLKHGMTDRCEVVSAYDDLVQALIAQIVQNFTIRGPCNIQSILTSDRRLIPFEVNCRYSGTNSIRSHFGFNDVELGLREFLFGEVLTPLRPVISGCALRVYLDIIYPEQTLKDLRAGSGKAFLF